MHTVKAIILKSIPHSEQQQILHVYSEERGYMQMITPLALFKRKANASAQCMQIVEIEFIPNERGGLHKLKSFSPLVNTSAILKSKRVRKRGNDREKPIITKILSLFPIAIFGIIIGT